jgi:hypothetical protein
MSSPILKSFTFVPQPKSSSDPLIIKRERMVSRLEDQKKLLADPNFVRTVKRWERKEGGEKVLLERPLRTSRWQPDQNGGFDSPMKFSPAGDGLYYLAVSVRFVANVEATPHRGERFRD